MRLEHPALRVVSADITRGSALKAVTALTDESETAWSPDCRAVRLRKVVPSASCRVSQCGAYAITGGLGGLGLRAASLLVDRGSSCVLLLEEVRAAEMR